MRWERAVLILVAFLALNVGALAMTPGDGPGSGAADQQQPRVIVRNQVGAPFAIAGGPRLGVTLRDLDNAGLAEHKVTAGTLVEDVEAGSAAEKAGVKAGDVITEFDGDRVRSVRQLQRLVGDTPPERRVKLVVNRAGKRVELEATLPGRAEELADDRPDVLIGRLLERQREDLPRRFEVAPFERWQWQDWTSAGGTRLGLTVQNMTPELREYFGAKDGVLVTSVKPDSAAARAGLRAGDVITSIDGKTVADTQALLRSLRDGRSERSVSLGVVRDRKPQTVTVKPSAGGTGGKPAI